MAKINQIVVLLLLPTILLFFDRNVEAQQKPPLWQLMVILQKTVDVPGQGSSAEVNIVCFRAVTKDEAINSAVLKLIELANKFPNNRLPPHTKILDRLPKTTPCGTLMIPTLRKKFHL